MVQTEQTGLLAHGSLLPLYLPISSRNSGNPSIVTPHSQWRDRAGISPDFPIKPKLSASALLILFNCLAISNSTMKLAYTSRTRING